APGDAECDPGTGNLRVCGDDHLWQTNFLDCLDEPRCDADLRRCLSCVPSTFRCASNNIYYCSDSDLNGAYYPPRGQETLYRTHCNGCTNGSSDCTGTCYDGGYLNTPSCGYPGATYTVSCNASNVRATPVACPTDQYCVPGGLCSAIVCTPNSTFCEYDFTQNPYTISAKQCSSDGTSATLIEDCGNPNNGLTCDANLGKCLPTAPGNFYCNADGDFVQLDSDGNPKLIDACGGPALCDPDRGCLHADCVPGSSICDGSSVLECTDGIATDPKDVDCGSATRCEPGMGCTHAIALGAGEAHTCAIMAGPQAADGDDGFLLCWGANDSGQLGNGSSILGDSLEPRHVIFYPGGDTTKPALASPAATSVCGGKDFSCATVDTPNGARVACWGSNARGQLGINSDVPDPVNYAGAFVTTEADEIPGIAVACGSDFACAIGDDGSTWCWGANDSGQLGDGTAGTDSPVAELVSAQSFVAIGAGAHHVCGTKDDGKVFCWGEGMGGQLGSGATDDLKEAKEVPMVVGSTAAAPALGRDFSLVVADGAANPWAFGANAYGQLGTGDAIDQASPVAAAILSNDEVDNLYSGTIAAHACAKLGSRLVCWGANVFGQLGNDTTDTSLTPVEVFDGTTNASKVRAGAHSVAVGGWHTCAITAAGDVLCWGANHRKQLGVDALSPVTRPTQAL
ncbi:MAG TPA: hypothetical protein VGP93_20520, partial [Polyangiaceae bacterium]|nr:hypothetical protein [Polyangiaceae bacterium]